MSSGFLSSSGIIDSSSNAHRGLGTGEWRHLHHQGVLGQWRGNPARVREESTGVGDRGAGPAGLQDCSQGEEGGWRKVCLHQVQGQQYLPGALFSGYPSRLGGLVPAVGLLPEVRVEGSS